MRTDAKKHDGRRFPWPRYLNLSIMFVRNGATIGAVSSSWPMIHGLHVVEGCTEGIRFGAWKGWSVVALKGQEKAGEEKVWVDL